MPKKDYSTGEAIISETGNWNVASEFARIKIMIPLTKCEHYEDLAKFGSESIAEELIGYEVQEDLVKHTALKRLINELLKICNNTKFAMKVGNSKKNLGEYEEKLIEVKNILPILYKVKIDNINNNRQLKLLQPNFDKTLEIVLDIKSAINFPLNQNHLIFTDKEEFDPHKYKDSIKKRMTDTG